MRFDSNEFQTGLSSPMPNLWFGTILLGLAYFGCATLANYLVLYPGGFVHFWLPSGLFVGVLLIHEKRYWPWLLIAALGGNVIFDLSNGKTLLVSLLFFSGNALEALVGAWGVSRVLGTRASMFRLRDISTLIVISVILSTTLSAFIGSTVVTHLDISKPFWQTWLFWWSGDAVGILLVTPLLLLDWKNFSARLKLFPRKTEGMLSLLFLLVCTFLVFNRGWSMQFPLKFLLIPLIVWISMRFGVYGAVLANILLCFTATWFGARSYHDLVPHTLSYQQDFLYLQLFLATIVFVAWFTSAILAERKQAEQSLRENERTLQSLMEMMPVGIAWVNMAGQTEYINRYFTERFGYTRSDLPTLFQASTRLYPDEQYRDTLIAQFNASLATSQKKGTAIPPLDSTITCPDGTVRHVMINTEIVQNRILHTFTDITDLKKMQAELLKTQKLESLSILAGGIAHDFNNILTGILGNISFANMFLESNSKAVPPLERAEKATRRAAELAGQLLTFARGGSPIKTNISVPQLIRESVSFALRGSNVRGILDIPDSLHSVDADEGQLNQVFNNIIINATQSMPQGGNLTIQGENVRLENPNSLFLPAGPYIKLSFTDEGCGIPQDMQVKIFDPYFSTKTSGSGLGLATVHSIIEKHGGYVGVSSEMGRGATFYLYLPSKGIPFAEPPHNDLPLAPENHAGLSILIMDDDSMIRELARGILEHLGYHVTTCANGREAINAYKMALSSGQSFFAAVMDLTIPGGMGGKEAAHHILTLHPTANLIVSSGYSNDPVMAEFKQYGFCAALAKPYRTTEMARVLASLQKP